MTETIHDVDEAMVFNTAISATEVKQLYYGGLAGGNMLDSSITNVGENWTVGFYELNATTSGTAYNSSAVTVTS